MAEKKYQKQDGAPLVTEHYAEDGYGLLHTKLFPPVSGSGGVTRSRLLHCFDSVQMRRLLLIAALAGCGKTTLMAQGYRALQNGGARTAWVSLDADDQSLRRLLIHVLAALSRGGIVGRERTTVLVESCDEANLPIIIRELVNLIAALDEKVVLFLDDYHRAETPASNEFLEALLTLSPPNFHLVLAGRGVPDLALSSLRVQDNVMEIDAQALSFDEEEARIFIKDMRGIDLSADQLSSLQQQTEGWVAGLQLAALALNSRGPAMAFQESLKGDARAVADYLASEVLASLDPAVRDFLLDSCVLNRMNAEVCNLLGGREDSQSLLERLEADNLFVVPLDQNRSWYRYHHMFRDFLIHELRKTDAARYLHLNALAATWFEGRGLMDEALEHYIQACEEDKAATIVEDQARQLIAYGRMHDLTNWIERMPKQVSARRPRLYMYLCWALFHTRDHLGAANALSRAETIVDTLEAMGSLDDEGERKALRDELEVLKAGTAIAADDQNASYELTRKLLSEIEDRGTFLHATLHNIHGYACYARSSMDAAQKALRRAAEIHRDNGTLFGLTYAEIFEGQLEMAQGSLRAAYGLFKKSRQTAQQDRRIPRNLSAVAEVMRATVLYEWNQLDEAAALLDENLDLAHNYGHPDSLFFGLSTRARIAVALGDDALAEHNLALARAVGSENGSDRFVLLCDLEYMRFLLLRDRLEEAYRVSYEHGAGLTDKIPAPGDEWDRCEILRAIMRFRLASGSGNYDVAGKWGEFLITHARTMGRKARLVQFLSQASVLREDQGDRAGAFKYLEEALSLAHSEGFIRTFVDEGDRLCQLLRAYVEDGKGEPGVVIHARRLLLAFDDKQILIPQRKAVDRNVPASELVEPLSDRELEVLRLLAAGRANRAIAAELRLSENTVKWHLKNIFEKLGVSNRTTAVLAAQQFDLIH
jgi:LuxR family maltose regulon positive regulatory protein